MKRHLLTILLFLLAGAVINVSLAWGLAATGTASQALLGITAANLSATDAAWAWRGSIGVARSDEYVDGWRRKTTGVTVTALRLTRIDTSERIGARPRWLGLRSPQAGCWIYESGWPLRSMRGVDYGDRDGVVDRSTLWAVLPRGHGLLPKAARFPLRPSWPGFAINTLFYAALLWLPFRGPFALRRHLRRHRGRCIKCGYDLRGELDAGCPECGWNRETV